MESDDILHVAQAQSAVSIGVCQKDWWKNKVYFMAVEAYAGFRNQSIFVIYHEHPETGQIVIEAVGTAENEKESLGYIRNWLNLKEVPEGTQ